MINKSYADQKQLVGADADYGEHLFGECVTCHNSTGLGQGIPKINWHEDQSIYYENFSL